MTLRRFWVGTVGPLWYDDTIAVFRFETATGTIEMDDMTGQSAAAVNIDGGTIDGVDIGQTSPGPIDATTLVASNISAGAYNATTVTATKVVASSKVSGGAASFAAIDGTVIVASTKFSSSAISLGTITAGDTNVTTFAADVIDLQGATKALRLVDAGEAGATEAAWIQIRIGASTTLYLRAFTTK